MQQLGLGDASSKMRPTRGAFGIFAAAVAVGGLLTIGYNHTQSLERQVEASRIEAADTRRQLTELKEANRQNTRDHSRDVGELLGRLSVLEAENSRRALQQSAVPEGDDVVCLDPAHVAVPSAGFVVAFESSSDLWYAITSDPSRSTKKRRSHLERALPKPRLKRRSREPAGCFPPLYLSKKPVTSGILPSWIPSSQVLCRGKGETREPAAAPFWRLR